MSKFELDEHDVQVILLQLRERGSGMALEIAHRLETQIPIEVPTKIGAVVQTDSKLCAPDMSVFLRWASDEQTDHPWILREELDLKPYSTKEIGRITEVLSEGVDL